MKKIFIIVLIIFCSSSSFAAEKITSSDISGLSLEECLNIALTNHPSLKKSKGAVRASRAALEQTKSSNRVKVNLTSRTNFAGDYKTWDSRSASQMFGISATKTLYDTGVNRLNREISMESLSGVLESDRQTQINVAAEAKKAYYDLVLKILNRDVEREKLKNLEEHLITAKGLYEVGNSPFINVTKAEADAATARVSLLKAENDILTSQESLKVAMGVSDYEILDLMLSTSLLLPKSAGEISKILETAMNDRADYRKILHTLKQRELEIKAAARGNSPTITGSIGTDWGKSEGSPTTTDYTVGVSVNVPVEDGGLTAAKIEAARAQLDQDLADEESLRQTIAHDLRSAALTLTNAIERAKSSELSVQYAEENLTLARGRYEVGVGDPLEVSDAVSTLASSRYTFYQALYDAQIARTNLDQAMGHLPEELGVNNYGNN